MVQAVRDVEQVLGTATESGISQKEIRDSLWDSYFDVDGTVSYYLDVIHKREQKKKREQGNHDPPPSPFPPPVEDQSTSDRIASLSLNDHDHDRSSPLPPRPNPPSKLAAKIAAHKQVARSCPSTTTTDKVDRNSSVGRAEEDKPTTKKPLSKLQLKMLAKQQRQQQPIAPPSSSSPPIVEPAPTASPRKVEGEDAVMGAVDDGLPPIFTSSAFPNHEHLAATPSPFATSLVPAPSSLPSSSSMSNASSAHPTLKQRDVDAARVALARHLAKSIHPVLGGGARGGGGGRSCGWGLSPDDKVLEARKGTALGGIGVKRK